MTEYTDDQRARALELYSLYYRSLTGEDLSGTNFGSMSSVHVKAWLELEDFVLNTFNTHGGGIDSRVRAWHTIIKHPFFADCYTTERTLLEAMIAALNAAHFHVCQQWSPTTADEIQPGWEIRARDVVDGGEMSSGVAHHQNAVGDWYTEDGFLLVYSVGGWAYETTAPMPKPNPRIQIVRDWHNDLWGSPEDGDILELLTRINALKEGEQS